MPTTPYQILPPLSQAEYESLKADIQQHGVLVPVEFDEDGNLLDGHHRLRACAELGVADIPRVTRHFSSETEKIAHILALNLSRRHLSPEQIAEVRRKQRELALQLRQEGKTQAEVARMIGVTRRTVDAWEDGESNVMNDIAFPPDLRVAIPKEEYPRIIERLERGEPHEKIAADYKVTRQRIGQIKSQVARIKKDRDNKKPLLTDIHPGVRRGDFRQVLQDIPDGSASLILTDPPYGKEYLDLWTDLGVFAARVLKDSGILIAYSGQLYLPQVLANLSKNLDYWWLGAVRHGGPGNLTPLSFPVRKVINKWKPLLMFVKRGGGYPGTFTDFVEGAGAEKDAHNWQQPLKEAVWLIEQFTGTGELVIDPFAGSGTVARACDLTGRVFAGAEVLANG